MAEVLLNSNHMSIPFGNLLNGNCHRQSGMVDPNVRRRRLAGWIDKKFDGVQARFLRDVFERSGVDMNQGELSGLIGGKKSFGEKKARALEDQAGMPAGYLDGDGNVEAGPDLRGKVPLISWVQAGDFQSIVDNFHPGQADDWVETTVPIHQHTYALRVAGPSMTRPSGQEPTFPDGSKIVVEPDLVDGLDNMLNLYVIARKNGDSEATFKQLVKDAGQFWLMPLNPQFEKIPVTEDTVICGVVREKVLRLI